MLQNLRQIIVDEMIPVVKTNKPVTRCLFSFVMNNLR